jgi:hypothetical protein
MPIGKSPLTGQQGYLHSLPLSTILISVFYKAARKSFSKRKSGQITNMATLLTPTCLTEFKIKTIILNIIILQQLSSLSPPISLAPAVVGIILVS